MRIDRPMMMVSRLNYPPLATDSIVRFDVSRWEEPDGSPSHESSGSTCLARMISSSAGCKRDETSPTLPGWTLQPGCIASIRSLDTDLASIASLPLKAWVGVNINMNMRKATAKGRRWAKA